MDIEELEGRVRALEERLNLNKKKSIERRARVEAERGVYRSIVVRLFALLVAYPVVSLFYQFVLGLSDPWLRGLVHVITIGIFVFVTWYVRRALLKSYGREDKEEEREII